MISDILSDAIDAIEEYQDLRPQSYLSMSKWINGVKAVMRGLQMRLDTPPMSASEPPDQPGLERFVKSLKARLGLEIVIRATDRERAQLEVISPTGVGVVGGLAWFVDGKWILGGYFIQCPEWWTPEEVADHLGDDGRKRSKKRRSENVGEGL